MNKARSLSTGTGTLVLAVLAGASSSYGQPAPSAAPAKGGVAISAHAWPTEASAAPKEGEWASAVALEAVKSKIRVTSWGSAVVTCTQRALRDWVRVTCTPPHDEGSSDVLFGALWGMAGEVAKVKGKFAMSSELPRYAQPPTDETSDLSRKMGASATVTFPVRPGGAVVLRVDFIDWDVSYDGGMSVITRPGMLIDVSWALGETHPIIAYR